jgi:hypothetical protein
MGREATQHKRGITKENAAEMARKATQKRMENAAERKVMRDIVLERVSAEDRAAICDALKEKAKAADKDAIKLLLQLMGEMPDEKLNIGMTLNALTDADRSLLEKVDGRV